MFPTSRLPSARLYFYDARTGEELSDHPLHGAPASGLGSYGTDRKGRALVRGMKLRHSVYVARYQDLEREVTSEEFGGRPVVCKFWTPAKEMRETFWLTPAA